MNSYLKVSSTQKNKNCNCISPFYIDNITGINPNTGQQQVRVYALNYNILRIMSGMGGLAFSS